MLLWAIFVPNVALGLMILLMYSLNEETNKTKNYEALLCCLNLDRAVHAWRYLRHGQQPNWGGFAYNLCMNLSTCAVPASASNIWQLLSNTDSTFIEKSLLILHTVVLSIGGVLAGRIVHVAAGAPANFEKYRLWSESHSEETVPVCVRK
eukprot:TRINITY_DN83289_c0_g1_i1.p1 TRINITY_DN83289_c0_g1~~TRINITY_DN83289_c0_g1_i1.p1  ORF type:complete len:161 (-),score=13.64 TRINITY_DN83289_c0_g1_i1:104-553(-)